MHDLVCTDPNSIRLRWMSGRGVASTGSVSITLSCAPVLPGINLEIEELDYAPLARVALIREKHHGWRNMFPDETAEADAYLARLAAATLAV